MEWPGSKDLIDNLISIAVGLFLAWAAKKIERVYKARDEDRRAREELERRLERLECERGKRRQTRGTARE